MSASAIKEGENGELVLEETVTGIQSLYEQSSTYDREELYKRFSAALYSPAPFTAWQPYEKILEEAHIDVKNSTHMRFAAAAFARVMMKGNAPLSFCFQGR
ncbi:MAG TPA: hypothetical protein VMH34_05050 [Gammaproteobacteria bacterium]|nr:hypothetical protein [Gammaproteobacteria bacterium]